MKTLITPILPFDHSAVTRAAVALYSHIKECDECDLMYERLCGTGARLREEKYVAVSKKWGR